MPANTYGLATVQTRYGLQGAVDKSVQCMGFAKAWGDGDREFAQAVLDAVRHAGSRSDEQVKAWEARVCQIPYRRDPPTELLRDPMQTLLYGGDCDDLTCCFLAGCIQLGIPCAPQLLCDDADRPDDCDAYHIRAVVGLPPSNPADWYVVDPVMWTERQWHAQPQMAGYMIWTPPDSPPQPEAINLGRVVLTGMVAGATAWGLTWIANKLLPRAA